MQILTSKSSSKPGKQLILVFGLGMIGCAIRDTLLDFDFGLLQEIEFSWHDSEQRNRAFRLIESACLACSPTPDRLSVLWSAGNATFHSNEDDLLEEHQSFTQTLDFVLGLGETLATSELDFHYISSAGGLFEGQRVVSENSVPAPTRPYGRMKLAQEKLLKRTFAAHKVAIYRPSTVYGPKIQKSRQGLINNLVSNGRNGKVTILDSHVMALRDYVFSGDVGNFVAKRIISGDSGLNGNPVHYLVSSRCSSIFEVVQKIERNLHIKLQYRYDESFGNHSNITFNSSVLPRAWSPSTLDVGIRQFLVGKYA